MGYYYLKYIVLNVYILIFKDNAGILWHSWNLPITFHEKKNVSRLSKDEILYCMRLICFFHIICNQRSISFPQGRTLLKVDIAWFPYVWDMYEMTWDSFLTHYACLCHIASFYIVPILKRSPSSRHTINLAILPKNGF